MVRCFHKRTAYIIVEQPRNMSEVVFPMLATVRNPRRQILKQMARSKYLYLLFLLPMIYFVVFKYGAMMWLTIAFKNFKATRGLWGSDWVGLKYFEKFLTDAYFWKLVRNTVLLNLYGLIFSFPAAIILALMINEVRMQRFKKLVQTVSYMPYFISTVAVCGLITTFLSSDGLITMTIKALTGNSYALLTDAGAFRSIYIISDIWQHVGWGSIIYLAALTGIDPGLYEAAEIDGASRLQQTLHVSLPSIASVIAIQFLLTVGRMMDIGYEKILLLYTGSTYETADVISTYLYRRTIIQADYSYGAAISLFQAVLSLLLVSGANKIAQKVGSTSLW